LRDRGRLALQRSAGDVERLRHQDIIADPQEVPVLNVCAGRVPGGGGGSEDSSLVVGMIDRSEIDA
jgi:hypothetical protein